ncbi:hypothetical protein [Streptomyces sp. H34-S4]|uniref:hypothetical protein n=1 Tax=Streptomyces sp. H34-S4 TaxID=2996463 RepID=UPI0022719D15|nr:hypothetical protein [Streptomyces sp. H34-S4]MCY0939591.1 hypothetical protein [Streptomyces sp. H34-S4]
MADTAPIGPVIAIGIAMAERANPVRQNISAHTNNAPDQVRSAGGRRRVMRAIVGHCSQPPRRDH